MSADAIKIGDTFARADMPGEVWEVVDTDDRVTAGHPILLDRNGMRSWWSLSALAREPWSRCGAIATGPLPDAATVRRMAWIAEHPPAKVRAELAALRGEYGVDGASITPEIEAMRLWLKAADAIDRC